MALFVHGGNAQIRAAEIDSDSKVIHE